MPPLSQATGIHHSPASGYVIMEPEAVYLQEKESCLNDPPNPKSVLTRYAEVIVPLRMICLTSSFVSDGSLPGSAPQDLQHEAWP